MSLIQVSSQSNREANQLQQQSGFRFSNAFNGVLEVPPYSEVALHSGQFVIDTGAGSVDFVNIGGDGGNQFPAMRLNFATQQNDYFEDWEKSIILDGVDTQYTANATTNPFIYFAPRKKYADVSYFWKDMVDVLQRDPRPQLQAIYGVDGSLLTGLSVSSTLTNATIKPVFTLTRTAKEDPTPILQSVFKTKVITPREITLSPITGNIFQTSGASGRAIIPSLFYTQSSGIHNDGGSLSIDSFVIPSPTTATNITTSNLIIGIKRWGFDGGSVSRGWSDMREAVNFEVDADFAETPESIPYKMAKMLYSQSLYGLSSECICDFAFQITNKVRSIGSNGGKAGFYNDEFCCNILKYEKGGLVNGYLLEPRYIMIATGDALVANTYDIPYSKQLDPLSGLATWEGRDLVVDTAFAPTGAGAEILISGNKVTFLVNEQVVNTIPEPASEDDPVILTDWLSDAVYPLQVSGVIYKNGNGFAGVNITPVATQREVPFYGYTPDDIASYVVNRTIIPAEIFNNNFNDVSPYLASFPTDLLPETAIPHRTPNSFTDLADFKLFMYVGGSEAGDARVIETTLTGQPNISAKVGSASSTLVFTDDTAEYSVDKIRNPMLNGLYVRLKNLPHKTTMGSINSVDNDKLIGIVNRYDHTDDEENLTSFPIYSFSEYDRLYVSLNNPAPIYLSSLDFEIVDKYGTPFSAIQNTTLTLHLRPATYKDLYGYKAGTPR